MKDVSTTILKWYRTHQRELPWRSQPEPYRIWLSEVILQQTRVDQGIHYYHRFVDAFPTVQDLAAAEEDTVLKLWQGLGYYNRARNLHAAANQVVNDWNGAFPRTYTDLLTLKGIGPYTAAAIASIAYNQPHAVVDGNVIRVIARLFGIEASVSEGATQRRIQQLADELLDPQQPGDHNQAMMEFGALQCTPRHPSCHSCPLSVTCQAHQQGTVDAIPKKTRKTKRRSRHFHYLVAQSDGHTLLQQRGNDDIWSSLFEFPLRETEGDAPLGEPEIAATLAVPEVDVIRVNSVPKHVLSHQDIHARFYHVRASLNDLGPWRIVTLDELHTFALPRLIDRYLENYDVADGSKRH